MSERLGPREQDFFTYHHMKAATSVLKPNAHPLYPRVSYAFAIQDQINRCVAQGIEEERIVIGAVKADIDARRQIAGQPNVLPAEDL
jgi:hypothetical protein